MLFAVGGEIMDTVSGFELDDMKIYRIRKIEIMSSEFWSKDEYLMYLVDEEWKETKVWIPRRFFDDILEERRKDNVNIYTTRPILNMMGDGNDEWIFVANPTRTSGILEIIELRDIVR